MSKLPWAKIIQAVVQIGLALARVFGGPRRERPAPSAVKDTTPNATDPKNPPRADA